MTIEEAINVINTWIEPMRKTLTGTLTHEFIDAVEVMELNCIKYGWHDLKKDPKDLPNIGEMVLAETDNANFVVAVRYSDCWTINTPLHLLEIPDSVKVIAWKYIEPFEEVE